jgi:hypothetical protein
MTSHLHHDKCIAAGAVLRDRDPVLYAKATARGVPITCGTPEHDLLLDMDALNAMAASFATGDRVSARQQRRAARVIVATGV